MFRGTKEGLEIYQVATITRLTDEIRTGILYLKLSMLQGIFQLNMGIGVNVLFPHFTYTGQS